MILGCATVRRCERLLSNVYSNRSVELSEWARSFGVHPQTAYRWLRDDRLPVAARRANQGVRVDEVVSEVGSRINGRRRKLARILRDPKVGVIVVEHRDRTEVAG